MRVLAFIARRFVWLHSGKQLAGKLFSHDEMTARGNRPLPFGESVYECHLQVAVTICAGQFELLLANVHVNVRRSFNKSRA